MEKPAEYFKKYLSDLKNIIYQKKSILNFKSVQIVEHSLIKERRQSLDIPEGDPEKDAVGLALSGGGVRSATFNLGLLQALDQYGFLKWVDYLSTVSGGGYIGSSLSWFLAQKNGKFPFRKTYADDEQNKPLRWLRCHASYLSPGDGLDIWALMAAFIRGLFINLIIIIPIFFALTFFLSWNFLPDLKSISNWTSITMLSKWPHGDFFFLFFWIGITMLLILLLLFVFYAVFSKIRPIAFEKHRKFSVQYGRLLKTCTILIILGLLPLIHSILISDRFKDLQMQIISSISIAGFISFLTGWLGLKKKDETQGIRAFLLRIGLTLAIIVPLLIAYHYALRLHVMPGLDIGGILVPWFLIILAVVLFSIYVGYVSDINHVSMHRYYRNRLLEAYMPEFRKNSVVFSKSDKFYLSYMKIGKTGAPYHIVNGNLNTTGSKLSKLKQRGGDNFIFSPGFIGSKYTGYRKARSYIGGKMSLATAFSISGAAVDPNTGVTRSRPLAFIMTLLNVRLGCWLVNPKQSLFIKKIAPPFWHTYAFKEMLGWGMNEENSYIHISDGGHFENLGLYELIQRKCPYIIVSDAGADSKWLFKDLARLCELVRVDFCSEVEVEIAKLIPDKETGYSEKAFVFGKIKYLNEETNEFDKTGKLIYIKTTLTETGLPQDIYGYKRTHNDFPDESTANQFFNEAQFEAYRELGYRIGESILKDWKSGIVEDVFNI